MKKCLKCNQIYLDDTLNYCLVDGERLFISNDSQPTIVLDPNLKSQFNSKTSNQGVNPIFAYTTIGLLALLIGGGLVAWLKSDTLYSAKTEPTATNNFSTNNSSISPNIPQKTDVESPKNSANNQTPSTNKQPPIIVKVPEPARPPVSSSKTQGLKRYNGSVNGQNASFDLVWNEDKTISGSYYISAKPRVVYSISGTNYVEGTSELNVSSGSDYIGQMTLKKNIEGSMLCWQGYFNRSSQQYVQFCRKR